MLFWSGCLCSDSEENVSTESYLSFLSPLVLVPLLVIRLEVVLGFCELVLASLFAVDVYAVIGYFVVQLLCCRLISG